MKFTAREIWLRQQREAKLKAAEEKTVTKTLAPVTKPPATKPPSLDATKVSATKLPATKGKIGRPLVHNKPMSNTERSRRYRKRLKAH
jgi:hypothetical protein